jgi:hypothetical protein
MCQIVSMNRSRSSFVSSLFQASRSAWVRIVIDDPLFEGFVGFALDVAGFFFRRFFLFLSWNDQ